MSKFWTFKNAEESKNAELMLYGPISEYSWWGDEVTPKQFADDLRAIGDVDAIDVRINSSGGDVFAAQAIFSLLKANSAKINVYIDGLAASAATIIAMAGDTIYIPPNAMMMVHNPLVALWGNYNIADFEDMTEVLEKVKDSIIACYQVKTGKESEVLAQLMDDETWLTGQEAVDEGFADELLYGAVNCIMNGKKLMINNQSFDVSKYKKMPTVENFTVKNGPQKPIPNGENINNESESDEPMTMEELKNSHPEIYNQIYNTGVENERQRLQAIDEIKTPGFENVKQDAKYKDFINAGDTAMRILEAQNSIGKKHLDNLKKDVNNSGLEDVEVDPVAQKEEGKAQLEEEAAKGIANTMNKKRGIK